MGLMGFAATLFLLSLGTYPVVEARLASLPYPAILLGLLLGLLLLNSLAGYRVLLTGYDKRIFAASMLLASWLAFVTAASSVVFGHIVDNQQYVGIGYILAFPILALIFRQLKVVWLLSALLSGCVLALSIGYIRFITLSGGIPSEHALGYWGIRYLPATRNSDVLYAIVSSLIATGLYASASTRLIRVVLMFVSIASFAAVIVSLSRGAWLALLTGYVALLWFTRQQHIPVRRRVQAIGVIVLMGIVFVTWFNPAGTYSDYDAIIDRMHSITDASDPSVSNRDRINLAMDAVVGILRHPTGVGVGNIAYALGRPMGSIGSAENAWLTIGLEGGWFALAAFSLVLLWVFLSINPIASGRSVTDNGLLSAIGTALVVAICSYLMFNYELNSLFLWSVLATVLGIERRGSVAIYREDIDPDGGL
jgi:hypothetical protein